MKNGKFTAEDGIAKLQPTKGTHCVVQIREPYFGSNICINP